MSWIQRHSVWLSLLAGGALALAFAPFDIWPLAVACPAFLFFAWHDATPRRAVKIGFAFSFGTFAAGTYWLYHSVYTIGKAPLPVTVLLMLGLFVIMGAYMAIVGYAQARWLPRQGALRYLVALPVAWTLLEWLRGWLFSGFPWLSLGYVSVDTWLAGYAPIVGVYGVSYLFALMGGALAMIFLPLAQRSTFQPMTHKDVGNAGDVGNNRLPAFALLLAPWLIAYPLKSHHWTAASGAPVTVAIVQGAVPQEMKWTQQQHDATLKLYRDLTAPHWGAQLIVWPESALPDWAESLGDYFSRLWQDAAMHRSDVLTGIQHYDRATDKAYNSVLALSDRVQWYNKRHLVPFGEYFPVPSFIREWMRLMSLPHSDFASGDDEQPPLTAAGQKIGVSICYEDAYAHSQLAVLGEATLLVNVTNDAWFGNSTARHQHLQISRLRAREAGRPLLRAANDGVSAILDVHGKIDGQLPSFKSAVLTGRVQPHSGLTPYARVGNWGIVLWCSALLAIAIVARYRAGR